MDSSLHANNITLTAMLVAVLAGTEAARFLLRDRQNRLYQRFSLLCGSAVVANLGLALATLTQARGWHVVHLVGSVSAGPTAVTFFLELLSGAQPRGSSLRPLLVPVGAALVLLVAVAFDPNAPLLDGALPFFSEGSALGGPGAGSTPVLPENWAQAAPLRVILGTLVAHPAHYGIALLVGIYMSACFGSILLNVLDLRARAPTRTERIRLNVLTWLGVATILGSLLQSTGSYFRLPIGTYPIGCLAQLAFFVFIAQVIQAYRLLDLHEMVSRSLIFLTQVIIIGGFYSLLLALFGDQQNWVNLGITIFLASGLVSAFHVPIAQSLTRGFNRLFFQRRFDLMVRLNALERDISRLLNVPELLKTITLGLRETPQITHAATFLWDERSREYVCVEVSAPADWPPMRRLASASPLARELMENARPVSRDELTRDLQGSRRRAEVQAALANLRRLDADVAVPFTGDGVLFGFVAVKDEALFEGFTNDELDVLQQLADRASVIIQNSDAIQRLKERDRLAALGQMSAGLAHEIRNPLGAIRGAAQYLEESGAEDPGATREFLDIIVEEVDRLNSVVSDFLDYSRPLRLQLQPHHPGRILSLVAGMLEAQGFPPSIHLRVEQAPDLPPVPLDLEKIKQVLLNLAQNAIQAMPEGGTLTLRAGLRQSPRRPVPGKTRPEATWLELQVMDSGCGIPIDRLETLFIPFFTTKARGTGLGLAISQRLVQAHHGEIEVESTEGQGSCFTVVIPLDRAVASEYDVAHIASRAAPPPTRPDRGSTS